MRRPWSVGQGGFTCAVVLGALLSVAWAGAQVDVTFAQALAWVEEAPDVVNARLDVEDREAALAVASAWWSGSASATLTGSVDPEGVQEASVRGSVTLEGSLSVPSWGTAAEDVARAEEDLLQARVAFEEVRSEVVRTVVRAFADTLRAQQRLGIENESWALALDRLEAREVQFEAGAVTQSVVADARLVVLNAEHAVASAERAALDAAWTLTHALGRDVVSVVGPLPAVPNVTDWPAALQEAWQAEDVTPWLTLDDGDLLAAELAVVRAERALRSAERSASPAATVSLGYVGALGEDASVQVDASVSSKDWAPSVRGTWNVGSSGGASNVSASVQASVPFGGAASTSLARLEADVARAVDARAQRYALAMADVASAVRSVEAAQRAFEAAGVSAERAQEEAEVGRTRLDLGRISVLDARTLEVAAREAEIRLKESEDALRDALLAFAASVQVDAWEVLP